MHLIYKIGIGLASLAAIGAAVDVWSNVKATGGEWDVAAYVIAVAVLGGVAGLVAPLAYTHNKPAGAFLAFGWFLAMVFSVGASIDRIGTSKDKTVTAVKSVNSKITRADDAVKRYRDRLDTQRPIAARECRGYRPGKSIPKRWPNCLTAQGLIKTYQARLDDAIAKRDKFGVVGEIDSGAARVAFLSFGFISTDKWRAIHPVLAVAALTLLTNALFLLSGSLLATAATATPTSNDIRSARVEVIEPKRAEITSPVVTALRISGPVNNRELAQRLGWSESKTSRAVRDLRRGGVVSSQQGERGKVIALAYKGQAHG